MYTSQKIKELQLQELQEFLQSLEPFYQAKEKEQKMWKELHEEFAKLVFSVNPFYEKIHSESLPSEVSGGTSIRTPFIYPMYGKKRRTE